MGEKIKMVNETKCYHTCPLCGANPDPDERCDCQNGSQNKKEREHMKNDSND